MSFLKNYREILADSEKPGGERNILDHLIYRKFSTIFLIILKPFRFSPNIITSLSILFSIVSALFLFYSNQRAMLISGVVFMNISLVLDTLDGQYSRLTGQQSEFGGWYDGVSDCVKYVFIFIGLSCGLYYHPFLETQWFSGYLGILEIHGELVLIMGMLIISNFFMIYYIHVSRYKLSFNSGTVVNLPGNSRSYFFGIESTLYTFFTVLLLLNQAYWLLVFLVIGLPLLWLYPFYLVYRKNLSES